MMKTMQGVSVVIACALLLIGSEACASSGKHRATDELAGQHTQVGIASWYGQKYHGRTTASGEKYNMNGMTAAHPSLPFGTKVRVTRLDTGRQIVVVINDRGPFVKGRIIDLSRAAAKKLDLITDGVTKVKVEVLGSK